MLVRLPPSGPKTGSPACVRAAAVSRPFCRTAFSRTNRERGVLALFLRPAGCGLGVRFLG